MNKIIVSDDRYGNSPYKVCNLSSSDYNIGDIVDIQEGESSRLAVITKQDNEVKYGDGCTECVLRNPELRQTIPCGYITSDGWFPCVALFNSNSIISFKPVETIMEYL